MTIPTADTLAANFEVLQTRLEKLMETDEVDEGSRLVISGGVALIGGVLLIAARALEHSAARPLGK